MTKQEKVVTLDEIPGAVGFPFKVVPTSWFQVDWTDALQIGDVKPLKYFKQDLVLFRTQDGVARMTSAFCPHMGAHLGYGGRVEGNQIVCPYHGWQWDGESGRNTLVPSEGCASNTPRVLKVWEVRESNGCIFAWHDALNRPPMWEAPAERRHERPFLPVYPACIYKWEKLRLHPQFIAENTVDLDHLIFVHGNTILPVIRSEDHMPTFEAEGHIWRNIRKPPLQNSMMMGLGISFVEFPPDPERPHRLPSMLFNNTTPIDDEHSDMFGTVMVEQDQAAEGSEGDVPVGRALKRVQEQLKQAGRDVPIWHNMVYMERPAYSRMEGRLMMQLRRWCQQFYPEVPDDGVIDERIEGLVRTA